jgi:hypothetical protein
MSPKPQTTAKIICISETALSPKNVVEAALTPQNVAETRDCSKNMAVDAHRRVRLNRLDAKMFR